ncbi:TPA: IncL/M type plasmid replication protein RepC [Escherichia coli]
MAQGTESLGCHFALSRNRPQLNLYLPKDAKRMLIEITKVKKLTQAEVIEFLVKSYYDGLKFDDSEE